MPLTTSAIFRLPRPTLCPLRVYLRQQGVKESEPSAFEQVLKSHGERHELAHLASPGPYEDLSAVPVDQRARRKVEAIRSRVPTIYQGEFAFDAAIGGVPVAIVGRADFLIPDGDGYLIRDSKLSLRVDEEHPIEIILQLQLYGWLYRQTVGIPPKRLQVHIGKGDVVDILYDGGTAALAELACILALKRPGAARQSIGVTAGFGPDGDREAWPAFLGAAARIFAEYGDIFATSDWTSRILILLVLGTAILGFIAHDQPFVPNGDYPERERVAIFDTAPNPSKH